MLDGPEHEQGEFNHALAFLWRLDQVMQGLDQATYNKQYDRQYRLLCIFYKELRPMMKPEERTEQKPIRDLAKQKFNDLLEAQSKKKKTISISIVDAFDDWEMSMRDILQIKGMLMPKKKDSRYGLS